MTVNTSTSTASYIGNGVTVGFPVPFYWLVDTDIKVSQKSTATGVVTVLTLNSDYTLTGAGDEDGGSMTLAIAPPAGDSLYVERSVTIVQQTAYPTNGPFPASSHERALDRLTMIAQEQKSTQALALIRDPLGSTYDLGANTLINGGTAINANDVPNLVQVQGLIVGGAAPALAGSNGSALVGFLQSGTGAITRTVADKLQDTKSVFDFMTTAQIADVRAGTALVDVAAAIQAAINAVTGTLIFPAGNYRINSALSWTKSYLTLQGAGEGRTRITSTFATGDIITCGNGSAAPSNCTVRDLSITSSVARSSGAAIRFRNGHSLSVDRVQLETNHFWGFQFDGGAQMFNYTLSNFEINSGVYGVIIGNDGTLVQDMFINGGIISSCTGAGILMLNVNGFYIKNVDAIACGNGVQMSPATGKATNSGWFDTVLCDTSTDNGWQLVTTGGTIADVTFDVCWSATSGTAGNGYGFRIDQSTGRIDGLNFIGPRIINNKAGGIYLQACNNVDITSPQIFGNSQVSSGGFAGVRVAPGVSNWSIVGGAIGLGGGLLANQQGWGVLIDTGASANYRIIGVKVTGNVTAGILDGGTGVKTIVGCPGYATRNSGVATIASGSSSVTFAHGLAGTPPAINVTPNGNPQQVWWVSGIGATNFTINLAANAVSNVFFNWNAWLAGN